MSGGEPFLRSDDLVEICRSAYRNCEPKLFIIPTNGILCGKIPSSVAEIAESCPKSQIIINLSIDGLGGSHDEIRGRDGAFKSAMKTYTELKELDIKNVQIGIHSVISRFNSQKIPNIYHYFRDLDNSNKFYYITEIAEERVELDNIGTDVSPNCEDYAGVIKFLFGELQKEDFSGVSKTTQAFRKYYYDLTKRVHTGRYPILPCYAGLASAHIASNGDVWQCCQKAQPLGNLTREEYNFSKIWFGEKANQARKDVREGHCNCMMANVYYTNAICNFKEIAKIGFEYIRQTKFHQKRRRDKS
jgi:MoaA/NifB/PqqE/SkfB family radical SAM enzyme